MWEKNTVWWTQSWSLCSTLSDSSESTCDSGVRDTVSLVWTQCSVKLKPKTDVTNWHNCWQNSNNNCCSMYSVQSKILLLKLGSTKLAFQMAISWEQKLLGISADKMFFGMLCCIFYESSLETLAHPFSIRIISLGGRSSYLLLSLCIWSMHLGPLHIPHDLSSQM